MLVDPVCARTYGSGVRSRSSRVIAEVVVRLVLVRWSACSFDVRDVWCSGVQVEVDLLGESFSRPLFPSHLHLPSLASSDSTRLHQHRPTKATDIGSLGFLRLLRIDVVVMRPPSP